LFSKIIGKKDIEEVKGQTGYPGIIKGKVKIIFDPQNSSHFEKGDILVTNMTRPDFVPLMKKAAAIVTDSGGLLCHAAVVAREMEKTTLIGTEKATKIFKDGDIVEVDAVKGIIRKL
jgi:pyruvate, water dikinase